MEAASTSEASVNFYQTTGCNIPEDNHLHTDCCENLKSKQYQILTNFMWMQLYVSLEFALHFS
jgi:hypothetical protein